MDESFELLVQQPLSLEYMALQKLGEWIILQAETVISRLIKQKDIVEPEKYITRFNEIIRIALDNNVPATFRDDLLRVGLQGLCDLSDKFKKNEENDETDKKIYENCITQMTDIFCTKDITWLWIRDILETSLYKKSNTFKKLIYVDLKSYNTEYTDEEEALIIEVLRILPKFRSLTYYAPDFKSDTVLKYIAVNCNFIEHLDLVYSYEKFNDNSVDIIVQLTNLKYIDISHTNVTDVGIANLLMKCKNIEHILSPVDIATAIENIAILEGKEATEFNLKEYTTSDTTTPSQVQTIIHTCPKMRKFTLSYTYETPILKSVQKLENLVDLCLYRHNFYGDGVNELLEAKVQNLEELSLIDTINFDWEALLHIAKTCPKLKTLHIQKNQFLPLAKIVSHRVVLPKISAFRNLKKLIYESFADINETPVDEFMFLILNSPNIEFISTNLILYDDIMLSILSKSKLPRLKNAKIMCNMMTRPVIDMMVKSNCAEIKNYFDYIADPTME